MEIPYVVLAPRAPHASPGAILQITAVDHPLSILEWKINQTDQVVSQMHEVSLVRMTAPASGSAATPAPLGSGAPAATFTAMVGPFASQGTPGQVLEVHAWNIVNSSLPWNPVPIARIELERGQSLSLLLTSPTIPTPLNLFGYVKILERR